MLHGVRASGTSELHFAEGLFALAKKDGKAAVQALAQCESDDHDCRFALVEAHRAAGDKKVAAEVLAKLKATPKRSGSYIFYVTRVK